MSSTPFIFRVLNPIMKGMLGSPFHSVISKQIMIITFTGRKSGQIYSTPVSYYQEDGSVYCFTHAGWWKNFDGGAEVHTLIRGQEFTGTAVSIRDNPEKMIGGLNKLLTAVPNDARYYDVKIDQMGNLDPGDLEQAVKGATMIEISIDNYSI